VLASAPRRRRSFPASARRRPHAELGLTTLAAVAAAPEQTLTARFGPNLGRELGRRARFEHDGEIGAERKVVSESRERTYEYDVRELDKLEESLKEMTRALCDSLLRNERRGRTIGIKVRLDDWTTVTRAHSIAAPTSDYETVFAVALRLLREYAPPRPVRLLGVRVAGLTHGEPESGSSGADIVDDAPQMALPV
jgi:DNA polymerase IV